MEEIRVFFWLLPVIFLILFETAFFVTGYFEVKGENRGPLVINYLIIGATAGLAAFSMPINIIMAAISFLVSIYFLAEKRKQKLLTEYFIALISGGAVFFLLVLFRARSLKCSYFSVLKSYGIHIMEADNLLYMAVSFLIVLLFIIEMVRDLLKSGKEDKAIEIAASAAAPEQLKPLPASTGALPKDFVLHRAGRDNRNIISSKEDGDSKELEFDIDVPEDDDFDIEVEF